MNALPAMDVAVFVGFASSGPLHTPVAVEDVSQFAAVFGEDTFLAWDQERGEPVYAYLAPAVRAFFANGGRRCWIIRVAGASAKVNYVPVPGLAKVSSDGAVMCPAFAQARSAGSWSDSVGVAAALISQPMGVTWSPADFPSIALTLVPPVDLSQGDLLRLTFEEGYVAMVPLQSVQSPEVRSPSISENTVRATAGTPVWFRTLQSASPPAAPHGATLFAPSAGGSTPGSSIPVFEASFSDRIALTLRADPAAIPLGALIRVDCGDEQLWLTVQDVSITEPAGSPPEPAVLVSGRGMWRVPTPQPLPTSVPVAERLTFNLFAREGAERPLSVTDLGFAGGHSRFWAALPADEELYRAILAGAVSPHAGLWQSATEPRFPFAGWEGEDDSFYVPIAMPEMPDEFYAPLSLPGVSLERDGLTPFDAAPFLDPRLSGVGVADLMAEADFLRYGSGEWGQSGLTKRAYLKGIHAALDLEEASIIAVPDAVHRGWYAAGAGAALPSVPSTPVPHPTWWHFLDCRAASSLPPATEPHWDRFVGCDVHVVAPPELQLAVQPDNAGTFTLTWSAIDEPATYLIDEATDPGFGGAVTIYDGSAHRLTLYGRAPGEYYYRARVVIDGNSSDWSVGIGVRVVAGDGWYLAGPTSYSAHTLLSVQRSLLRLCAARGDMVAVLSLPGHYRDDDAVAHVTQLKNPVDLSAGADVLPLDVSESRAFSYAALYHPWLYMADAMGNAQSAILAPPDGALCGVMARRTLARYAWISPGNEPIATVLALDSGPVPDRWLDLQTAQINLIRQEPHGFVSLNADTLSDDPDLRPINVRRLLILLRRLVSRLGPAYVFEPNNDAFRRLVQRGLEVSLQQLFVRGAFAGSVPAAAYQVIADSSVNTAAGIDSGRFVVDIKVAPSLPMTFLTVRLVQTGDGTAVVEGG